VVAALGILIPALNLLLPAGSLFQVPTYLVALFRKICLLRHTGARDRSDLGLLRHSLARARPRSLRSGGLCDGHVSDASDRQPRRLWQSDFCPISMVFLNYPKLPWYWHGFDMFLVSRH